MRQRITIQDRTIARDAFGAEVETWGTLATVWARIDTPSGSEYTAQDRAGAAVTQRVTIRTRAGIEPTMRIDWGGRILQIETVLADNVGREMRMLCSEVVSEERTS